MKNFLILLAVGGLSILAYSRWQKQPEPPPAPLASTPSPTPKPREPRLTPEGTFALVNYVSVRTKKGVVGFEPGAMVRFVSSDPAKGTLTVTDGTYQVEVKPDQITNDLDIAAIAKRQDQQSQTQLRTALAAVRDEDARIRLAADIDRAKDVAHFRSGAAVGNQSRLDMGAVPASHTDVGYYPYSTSYRYTHSPYAYLYH